MHFHYKKCITDFIEKTGSRKREERKDREEGHAANIGGWFIGN